MAGPGAAERLYQVFESVPPTCFATQMSSPRHKFLLHKAEIPSHQALITWNFCFSHFRDIFLSRQYKPSFHYNGVS